jgi:hypothetical protein
MAWLFAVMLVGLLPGCAQSEAQKEREALDAARRRRVNSWAMTTVLWCRR